MQPEPAPAPGSDQKKNRLRLRSRPKSGGSRRLRLRNTAWRPPGPSSSCPPLSPQPSGHWLFLQWLSLLGSLWPRMTSGASPVLPSWPGMSHSSNRLLRIFPDPPGCWTARPKYLGTPSGTKTRMFGIVHFWAVSAPSFYENFNYKLGSELIIRPKSVTFSAK